MKVIYSEETSTLLAKFDELINRIREEYQRMYPEPPDLLRQLLGEERYAQEYCVAQDRRRRAILEDSLYQECIQAKAKIIAVSPCTYQIDANEVQTIITRL